MMLDSYTSTLCVEGWGRVNFASALVEVHADNPLKESLVIAIPKLDEDGYTKETIHVEYEWRPSMCDRCKVFGHEIEGCPLQPKTTSKDNPKNTQKQKETKGTSR